MVVVVVVPVLVVVGQLDPRASILTILVPGQQLCREASHFALVVVLPVWVRVGVRVRVRVRI